MLCSIISTIGPSVSYFLLYKLDSVITPLKLSSSSVTIKWFSKGGLRSKNDLISLILFLVLITMLFVFSTSVTVIFRNTSGSYESGVYIPLLAIFSVIIVFSMKKKEIRYDAVQAPSKGNSACDCIVASSAKVILVR